MLGSDFPLWDELQRYILNGHKRGAAERALIKAAKAWLPYPLFLRGGLWDAQAPWSDCHIWHFAVEVEQERRWDTREFQEGRAFARSLPGAWDYKHGSPRDANRYKFERSRARSWDCGYILELSERKNSTS